MRFIVTFRTHGSGSASGTLHGSYETRPYPVGTVPERHFVTYTFPAVDPARRRLADAERAADERGLLAAHGMPPADAVAGGV
jgi:hypothetical protein